MADDLRRQNLRKRNIALALTLLAFAALFYVVTLLKGIPLLQRPL